MFEYFMFTFAEFAENSLVLNQKGNCYVELLRIYLTYFLRNEKYGMMMQYDEEDYDIGHIMLEIFCDSWLTQFKEKNNTVEVISFII
jgi:hypothetical protein